MGRASPTGRPRSRHSPRAGAGGARAAAAPGLGLAVPDHHAGGARLRRAACGRALCGVQAAVRDGGHHAKRRAALGRGRRDAAPARARGLRVPRPRYSLVGPAEVTRRRTRVLAMIMAGGKGERLHPLTRDRSKPAVPFAGRYRIVDFVLSNFVNSDMLSLYVLVQYKSQSLIEHVRLSLRTTGIVPHYFVTV